MLLVVCCWILATLTVAMYAREMRYATPARGYCFYAQTLLLCTLLWVPALFFLSHFTIVSIYVSFMDYGVITLALLAPVFFGLRCVNYSISERAGKVLRTLIASFTCFLLLQALIPYHVWQGVTDILLLFVFFVVFYRLPVLVMLAMRCVGVLSFAIMYWNMTLVPQARMGEWMPAVMSDEPSAVSVSTGHNVFVLLFDNVGSPAFFESAWGEIASDLNGFTFYPNVLGAGASSKVSIPYVLSGKALRASDMTGLYSQLRSDNIFRDFSEAGYNVQIASPKNYTVFCSVFAHCHDEPQEAISTLRTFLAFAYQGVIIPTPPEKHYEIANGLAPLKTQQSSETTFSAFTQRLSLGKQVPQMIFNESTVECETASQGRADDYQEIKNLNRCVGHEIKAFVTRLKELGVYEQSTIVVLSTRGNALPVGEYSVFASYAPQFRISNPQLSVWMPLLLIKFPSSFDDAATLSFSPVSLLDIRATLCRDIAVCQRIRGMAGTDVRLVDVDSQRLRLLPNFTVESCAKEGLGCLKKNKPLSVKPDLHDFPVPEGLITK